MEEKIIKKYVDAYKKRILEYEAKVSGKEDEILSKLGYTDDDEESLEDSIALSNISEDLKKDLKLPFRIKGFIANVEFAQNEEEEEEIYNGLIFSTFKFLIEHIGEEKLKELITSDYIQQEFKDLNLGLPRVFPYIDFDVDEMIEPDPGKHQKFNNSNKMISLLLDEFNPKNTFVLNISHKTPFFGFGIEKYSGITSNQREYDLFKNAYEECEVFKVQAPDDTNKFEKNLIKFHNKFDFVVTYTDEFLTSTKKGTNLKRYFIESSKCLNADGDLFFVAPTNITLNQNFKETLEEKKLFISAIFETNDTIFSEGYIDGVPHRDYIPLSIFHISKQKIDKIFSCQTQEKNIHYNKALIKNFITKSTGKIPSMGTYVKLDEFRGNKFYQWLDERNRQYKNTSIKPLKLIEISEEISFVDKDGEIEDNSLFINPNGEGHSKTKINLELEHKNYFQIKLKKGVDNIYLNEYFNSNMGRSTFSAYQFEGISQDRMDIETLKNILLFIPDYMSQIDIIKSQNALQNQLNYSKETLSKLFSADVHKNKTILRQVKKLNDQDVGFKNWLDSLPFPISSILLLYHTSAKKDEKISLLLNFFEAYAEFMCVILLSCFAQDQIFLKSNKHYWTSDKKWIERSSLGNWINLLDGIRKFISNEIKSSTESRNKIYSIIGTKDQSFLDFISNGQIIDILESVNQKRNDWKGHDGLHDQNDSRLNQLVRLLNKFRNKSGYIFDDFKLIKPGTTSFEDGIYYYKECTNLIGGNLPFKKINVDSEIPLDANRLYFQFENNLKPIKLLPFITYDETKGAIYFYSKITIRGNEIRYITYHFNKDKTDNIKKLTEEFKNILKNHF